MTSVATDTWGIVFFEHEGRTQATITGPESRTGTAPVPDATTFLGVQFAVGTALRSIATGELVDTGIELTAGRRSFWLDGGYWEVPRRPEDAESLVDRLVRQRVVERDPLVAEALRGGSPAVADRTLERRFRSTTGLTQGTVHQIRRARAAAGLLALGVPASDVVGRLGYYDEPHLARALRRYVGRTARQLRQGLGGAIALDPPQCSTSYTSLATPLE